MGSEMCIRDRVAALVEDLGVFLSSPLLILGDLSLGLEVVFDDVVSTL